MRPGGGGRFAKLTKDLQRKGHSKESARRIAASIGRKKYGKKKMAQWAAKGRRRASAKRNKRKR